jgi:hypothetical protein
MVRLSRCAIRLRHGLRAPLDRTLCHLTCAGRANSPAPDEVFKLRFPDAFAYRAFPVPRGGLGVAALRAGMTAMHPR